MGRSKIDKVAIPVTAGTQTVDHRVSRKLKHLSIVTCMSAGEVRVTPCIFSSQASGSVHQALTDTGLQIGEHLILRQRAKAYVNSPLFRDYIQRFSIAHLTILRQQEEFTEKGAALLMDNCPSPVKKRVLGVLTAPRVRIITFAPHAIYIFQVLDLTLFGAFQNRGQYQLPFEADYRTGTVIMRMYHDCRA
jgi:hypothetical protein